jgi:hypothetical protein
MEMKMKIENCGETTIKTCLIHEHAELSPNIGDRVEVADPNTKWDTHPTDHDFDIPLSTNTVTVTARYHNGAFRTKDMNGNTGFVSIYRRMMMFGDRKIYI